MLTAFFEARTDSVSAYIIRMEDFRFLRAPWPTSDTIHYEIALVSLKHGAR